MLYTKITPLLRQSPFFEGLQSINDGLQIYHLNQSARALVAADLWVKTGKNVILISQDDIIAEDLWDDLVTLVGRENAFYLPDYEILPYEERSPHYSIRATRMMSLVNTVSDIPAIYSLSIRSFLRYIPSKASLQRHILRLHKGDEIDPDQLLENLQNMGYEIDYQVSTVYQAAKRGGIMDIYSPPNLHPVRIEFWGDEIMSIRSFSTATQRSVPGELQEVTIIPARELALDEVDSGSVIIAKVREEGFFEGFENFYSLLCKDLSPFADYFAPESRIIVFNNYTYIKEEMEALTEQTLNQYHKEIKKGSKGKIPKVNSLILDEKSFYSCINKSVKLFVSQSEFLLPEIKENVRAPFESQPAFDADLGLLSQTLKSRHSQGWKHFLLFDNQAQEKRMLQMLTDEIEYQSHIGVLHEGFEIGDIKLGLWTDHEIFNRYKRKRYAPRFAPGETIVDYENLKPGDYVVHVDHGIGVFEGLKIIRLDGRDVECLVLRYANEDRVYVPTFQLSLVTKYVAEEGSAPALNKLGSSKWQNTKRKAAQQIELVAADLVKLFAERNSRAGLAHSPDTEWQIEMENSFIYEETPDQIRSTQEIKQDMELPVPMERLLCGDVGFGKTEVAIRAAFKAVNSGFQVAVLAPTTLLVEQHFRVFKERLAQYPVRIAMLSRFRSRSQILKDVADIAQGKVDIAIGTHRLLSKDIKFAKLGLLIIDEEHRFGVRHKNRLRSLQSNVDTLYMSATPIPRTLNMALAKLKDISLMQTSPKERLPIRTIITPRDIEVIKDAIRREVDRGGQIFFVHNRVQTIETVAMELRRAMPDISFAVGHAQMSEHHLEEVMNAFVNREFQVLICTTIIENGLDIANANTILIDRADTFGLAQLYQMRGRVGRSNRRAYAYLLIPKGSSAIARQRLEALTKYDYLGAGFQVALRDLELRGAGTILGTKQSGIIQAIGFNYYNRLLGRAIEAVESGDTERLYAEDSPATRQSIRTELDLYFPTDYIDNDEERLRIYRRLSELNSLAEIDDLATELTDRFGKIPENAHWLMLYFKVEILAKELKLRNCTVKRGKMVIEYESTHTPPKKEILLFSSKLSENFSFEAKQTLKIIIDLNQKLNSLEQFERAIQILEMQLDIRKAS